ncbi:MAG: IS110 family transposase [Chitinophagaceae bacterium]|nr:MAG: IS110 family transposase [Chitinophagaceae bacterium]
MKDVPAPQSFYVGIDVSKDTLDVSCLTQAGFHNYGQFENTRAGLQKLNRWLLQQQGFEYTTALFCMEHTGIYTRQPVEFLLLRNARIWMESALHLKRSIGMIRGKNDKVDSYRIARYAMVNKDEAKLVSPSNGILQLLKDLLACRTRINKSIQSLKVSVRELQRVDKASGKELDKLNKAALEGLKKSKTAIEKRMQELISSDPELKEIFALATSVKGVGRVLATELLIYTHKFTRMNNIKQLACYCGVAPFTHSSGTSVRGQTRTSHFANMNLKTTLHLAAMSSTQYVPDLRAYYRRRVAEGKPKMCVINAIRNKLLHRVLAVVKRGTPYLLNYAEINLVKS